MTFPRRLVFALVLVICPLAHAAAAKKQPSRPADDPTAYKGAIVIDAATGNVLFENRADVVTPPASMTKLMTFAVVADRLASGAIKLDTPVRITNEDAKIGGTQVFLDPRETFPVEELIYAMMIQSANDAAYALARATAGSVPAFVELMNAKAQELGMTHTTFRSPHGLPPTGRHVEDGDLTTPREFALLCRHLVTKTDILKYSSVTKRDFGPNRAKGPQHMENHNKLLGKVAGVDGLKTGFTDAALYCLSATAQRNGRRVILVIMGAIGPNGKRDLGRSRDIKAIELLERGFAALPPAPPAPAVVAADSLMKPAPRAAAPTPPTPAAPAKEEPMLKLNIPKR